MNKDNHLIYEAFESRFTQQVSAEISVAKNLMKMDDALHDMSTVIHMSKSSHIDQLLSRIRDTVEMLMSERGAGTSENAEEKPNYKAFNAFLDRVSADVKKNGLSSLEKAPGMSNKQAVKHLQGFKKKEENA